MVEMMMMNKLMVMILLLITMIMMLLFLIMMMMPVKMILMNIIHTHFLSVGKDVYGEKRISVDGPAGELTYDDGGFLFRYLRF